MAIYIRGTFVWLHVGASSYGFYTWGYGKNFAGRALFYSLWVGSENTSVQYLLVFMISHIYTKMAQLPER